MTFSILISTKDRLEDLTLTLSKLQHLIERPDVECLICDDGSTDSTSDFVKRNYPKVVLITHEKSKGYIYSRNMLLRITTAAFAISLDDDAHFLSVSPLEQISAYFSGHEKCGLIAFRIFWQKGLVDASLETTQQPEIVKGFVGCGHVWRMSAWRNIPNYPEWFVFYGEEEFGAFQLFKNSWQVHYLPTILVQHRVDMKARQQNADFKIRLRRSLRSGWYLQFLFLPKRSIPRLFAYSLWKQLKKLLQGNLKVMQAVFPALLDLLIAMPNIARDKNRLTFNEYQEYLKLGETKIFWKPEK